MAAESTNGVQARARRAARKICAETWTWSRQLGDSIAHPAMEKQIFREVLSYALHLVESREAEKKEGNPEGFHRALRGECVELFLRWTGTPRTSRKQLAARGSQTAGAVVPVWRERRWPERVAFEAFCRATGLGSDVLVGKEENLAGLVFYITIFTLCAAGSPFSGVRAQRLLRQLRDCRVHLARSAPSWLNEAEAGLTLPAAWASTRQIENAILL